MNLTPKKKRVLDFIKAYIERHGFAPSITETAKRFGLAISTVHQHLKELETGGYLEKQKNQRRGIEVAKTEKLVKIPLLGTIAAGQPIEAIKDEKKITVAKSQVPGSGDYYALRVIGNSMINDGIFDGDTVVVRRQQTAENGDTIVALINGSDVTLKKIYKEKNGFRLQPANPEIKPLFVKGLTVQGKVTSIVRNVGSQKADAEEPELTDETLKYIEKTDARYRKNLGQYFTPRSIKETLLERLPQSSSNNIKILDPACGTGEFLITARKYFRNAELYGWDIDKNLASITKKTVPEAKILNTDSLLNNDYGKYDFVIGNPPYFEMKMSDVLTNKFGEIMNGRTNIFGLFIYQGLKWLKDGGYLAYVVPPSMNNGAYFSKLRGFIINNSNVEHLEVIKNPKVFRDALQSTMLLILKKGKNKGDFIFKKNGVSIFSERADYLEKIFQDKITLRDLNYEVKTGRLVWNQNRHLLTNDPRHIPLIWAHNIDEVGLKFPIHREDKPQYVKVKDYDVGPAIVVNRITGSINSIKLKAAVIPAGKKFIAENHVNVIYPPKKSQLGFGSLNVKVKKVNVSLYEIAEQLSSKEKIEAIKNITGNTQISKTELEKLFPITATAQYNEKQKS